GILLASSVVQDGHGMLPLLAESKRGFISVRDALDSLGQNLAKNYFSKAYTDKVTDIHFEVLRIDEISAPSRRLRIAVVNMVDTNGDARRYFFQGSAGGQTTFCMLAATFIQPHLRLPLLDGLVLLY
ncbi:unnamed protein product, partial [marine sediment metagenome]